uniref:Ovule protein n=1 Tax=Syphacia muris TaxID=451379 RepID=A0A0N5A9A7_9BILA
MHEYCLSDSTSDLYNIFIPRYELPSPVRLGVPSLPFFPCALAVYIWSWNSYYIYEVVQMLSAPLLEWLN